MKDLYRRVRCAFDSVSLLEFLSKYQAQLDNILRDPSLLDPYQYIQTVLNLRGVSTLIVRIIQPARLNFLRKLL